jgi:hypothetical protein
LPATSGWEEFAINQPFILSGNKNLLFEISWGTTDNYAPSTDRTTVYATQTSYNSVAWGADDNTYPSPVENLIHDRPNTKFEFDSAGIINIQVNADMPIKNEDKIQACAVSINSQTKLTDSLGRTQFYFTEFTGDYTINFSTYGYADTSVNLHKTSTSELVNITLRRYPELTFTVKNSIGMPLENATVHLIDSNFITDATGTVKTYSVDLNNNAVFTINCKGYNSVTDTVFIDTNAKSYTAILSYDLADITVSVKNTHQISLQNIEIYLNGIMQKTASGGTTTFTDIAQGEYCIGIYNQGYAYIADTVKITANDTLLDYTLNKLINTYVNITDGIHNLSNISILLDTLKQTTNIYGTAEFNSIPEGKHQIIVDTCDYYQFNDTVFFSETDTSVNIKLNIKPDVTFFVSNGYIRLPYTEITIDTLQTVTDTNGSTVFKNLTKDYHKYTVNASGYNKITDSVSLSNDTILNIVMHEIPDVIFNITAPVEINIENIPLVFDTDTLFADKFGMLIVSDVTKGEHRYSINLNGYYPIVDTITIDNENVYVNIELQAVPDIKFVVSSSDIVINDAAVTLDDSLIYTDMLGEALFVDFPRKEYNYKITKQGYIAAEGNFIINNNDTAIYVNIKQQHFTVAFTVVSNNSAIDSALITINETSEYTDDSGYCLFENIPSGNCCFKVEKAGFQTYYDTISVYQNINYTVEFSAISYDVLFVVIDASGLVEGANVAFNEKTKVTDSNGKALFAETAAGSYQYTIWESDNHKTERGNITVNNDTTVNVNLQLIDISDTYPHIKIYPNPAKDKLFIIADKFFINAEYQILNSNGKIILKDKITDIPHKIELSNFSKGLYFIKINGNDIVKTNSFIIR